MVLKKLEKHHNFQRDKKLLSEAIQPQKFYDFRGFYYFLNLSKKLFFFLDLSLLSIFTNSFSHELSLFVFLFSVFLFFLPFVFLLSFASNSSSSILSHSSSHSSSSSSTCVSSSSSSSHMLSTSSSSSSLASCSSYSSSSSSYSSSSSS